MICLRYKTVSDVFQMGYHSCLSDYSGDLSQTKYSLSMVYFNSNPSSCELVQFFFFSSHGYLIMWAKLNGWKEYEN